MLSLSRTTKCLNNLAQSMIYAFCWYTIRAISFQVHLTPFFHYKWNKNPTATSKVPDTLSCRLLSCQQMCACYLHHVLLMHFPRVSIRASRRLRSFGSRLFMTTRSVLPALCEEHAPIVVGFQTQRASNTELMFSSISIFHYQQLTICSSKTFIRRAFQY